LLFQVGEFESSKSAIKTLAPEFSALMIILRSTGPVISTRRSRKSVVSAPLSNRFVGFQPSPAESPEACRYRCPAAQFAAAPAVPAAGLEPSRKFRQEGAGFRGKNARLHLARLSAVSF